MLQLARTGANAPRLMPACDSVAMIDGKRVYQYPDQQPVFRGSMVEFLQNNMHYPVDAQENGITGKAVIQFIIGANGKVLKASVFRSSGNASLDKEASG